MGIRKVLTVWNEKRVANKRVKRADVLVPTSGISPFEAYKRVISEERDRKRQK